MAIQFRRGAFADFIKSKMVAGEPAVVQSGDTSTQNGKAFYICYTPGSVDRVLTEQDKTALDSQISDIEDDLATAEQEIESVRQSIPAVDATLTTTGAAADAKKTGDEISGLKSDLDQKGLTEDAKTALLDCFAHVAWVDEHGQDYYDALEQALYGEVPLVLPDLSTGTWEAGHGWAADGSESNSNYLVINRTYYDVKPETEYTWIQGFSSYMQGTTYDQTGVGEMNQYQVCFYDSNKNFIERIYNDGYTTDIAYIEPRSFTFTTPSNAAYIRVACRRWPVGFFASAIPTDIYSVILLYGKTDDSDFVGGDAANVEAAISVLRNGENITLFAKTGSKVVQSLSETYQWGRCVFNVNGGADAEGGPATSKKNRYTVIKNMLLKEGDVIIVNGMKVGVWAQKLTGGTIQHTTSWLVSGDSFTIGGQ